MTFILDHCGNADPHIVAGNGGNPDDPVYGHTREQWLAGMQTVGALPNVVCKISGIVARAAPGWSAADLAPAVNHCIDSFGEDRIVFGSDWPVCTFGAPLGEWITALRADRQHPPRTPPAQAPARKRRTHLPTRVTLDPVLFHACRPRAPARERRTHHQVG